MSDITADSQQRMGMAALLAGLPTEEYIYPLETEYRAPMLFCRGNRNDVRELRLHRTDSGYTLTFRVDGELGDDASKGLGCNFSAGGRWYNATFVGAKLTKVELHDTGYGPVFTSGVAELTGEPVVTFR